VQSESFDKDVSPECPQIQTVVECA
jgi:hypothetical protein